VEAPDWDPAPRCGGGLHGLLSGEGSAGYTSGKGDAVWVVCRCVGAVVDLGGKVKCAAAIVIYAGSKATAIAEIQGRCPGAAVIYGTATAGYLGTATAGHRGTATAGYRGTATAGDRGTATAGYRGTATAGEGGSATAGMGGEMRIGWWDGTRQRCLVGYVGEDGICAGVAYRVAGGRLVPCS